MIIDSTEGIIVAARGAPFSRLVLVTSLRFNSQIKSTKDVDDSTPPLLVKNLVKTSAVISD
jgi:hypothetical protein